MSMQEAEEQDTCRICSAPAEPDQPLFHPCKCSGTIRYIHQDCLTTWLAHSKKKNCDVCKHPYAFTKVYAPDMPSSLPPLLLLKRLIQQLFWALLFVLRAVMVGAIWLGVLPWVTVWTWRMYFSMGESTAWWISDRPRPPSSEPPIPFYNQILYSSASAALSSLTSPSSLSSSSSTASPGPTSLTAPAYTPSTLIPTRLLSKISTHPLWLALSADIFAGQIIASLIVLTFVAVFLLREWISQNARPGVFEEEEGPAVAVGGAQPVAGGAPALALGAGAGAGGQQQPQPQPLMGLPLPPAPPLGAEGADANQPHDAPAPGTRARPRRHPPLALVNNNIDPEVAADPDRWGTTSESGSSARRRKARGEGGSKKHRARVGTRRGFAEREGEGSGAGEHEPRDDGGENEPESSSSSSASEGERYLRQRLERAAAVGAASTSTSTSALAAPADPDAPDAPEAPDTPHADPAGDNAQDAPDAADAPDTDAKRKAFHRRLYLAKTTAARRRMYFGQKLAGHGAGAGHRGPFASASASGSASGSGLGGAAGLEAEHDHVLDPSTSTSTSTSTSSALAHSPPQSQSSVSSPPLFEDLEGDGAEVDTEEEEEDEQDGRPESRNPNPFADPPTTTSTATLTATSTSIFPTVALQPPKGSIPFALRPSSSASSSSSASLSTPTPYSTALPPTPPPYSSSSNTYSSTAYSYPARPPLPPAVLSHPSSRSGSPYVGAVSPRGARTPGDVTASYRAPEELGGGRGHESGSPSGSGSDVGEGPSGLPPAYFDGDYSRSRGEEDETLRDHPHEQERYEDGDVDMDVDMAEIDSEDGDEDEDDQGERQEAAQPNPVEEQDPLFDSDVDMEAERRRYFRDEEGAPLAAGQAGGAGQGEEGVPALQVVSDSSDSSDSEGDEEDEDEHEGLHEAHQFAQDEEDDFEEDDDLEDLEEDDLEDDEEEVEGHWEVAEVDPAAIGFAGAPGNQNQNQRNALRAARAAAIANAGGVGGPGAGANLVVIGPPAGNRLGANANLNGNGNGNGNGNMDPDAAAAAALAAEEADGNVEDDMEGAMEAIGMRGPIYGVLQNAALMIFVLDTAIGLGVWIPFTIGKTTALLSLDPQRMLQVLHLPIRAMRVVTDPFVDFIQWILVDLLLPWLLKLLGLVFRALVFLGSVSAKQVLGKERVLGVEEFGMKLYNQSVDLVTFPLSQLSTWTSPSNLNLTQSTSSSLFFSSPSSNLTSHPLLQNLPDYLGFTEPYFTLLGSRVRESVVKFQKTWVELALGSGSTNRLFAVLLGYAVVAVLLGVYLNVLTVGNAKSAGRHVRNAVRQQLLVMKVATFIFIELVVFPLGCGIVLDLCTVWLFPEANMQSRVAFFLQAPMTAMFYHWVAGTMFMYSFAVLLSGCRSVMRPGAMWFIKDPQDQNSHPIRDILDRPTLVQLRKIFVSGIMYSFVVACVVGSVAGLVVIGNKSIMPFRWKNREPLSNVPVDLLFLHLVLPYTMHYFRPKRTIKQVTTAVWKYLAKRLRLTSYFFGGRHPEEEYTPKNWLDNLKPDRTIHEGMQDGTFRRVPATDNLALPRDMRATVAVTADGEPVDEAARKLMALQNAEAEKAKRTIADDYMIVYMPPHFRYRIMLFITLLWIFGAICLGFAVALPIQLGRSFFRLFTLREVHDGYSFIIGFYLIWTCYIVAKAIDRLDKRRQRRSGDGPRAELPVLVLKRGLLWLAKTAYMVFFLGVVIPVLLAIVVDLYMVLPVRFMLDPGHVPRIRIVDAWALGLLYAKIGMHVNRLQPRNRISRGLQRIAAHGWTRPDPITATKEVIAPLIGGLLGMIILPGLIFRTFQYIFPGISEDDRAMFIHVYPTVFAGAFSFRCGVTLYGVLSSWSQSIRDKEFLVEMRLKNHEPGRLDSEDSEDGSQVDDVEEAIRVNLNRDRGLVAGGAR